MERRQPPHQERTFDEVDVASGRLVVDAHAPAELRGVPLLPVERREHADQPLGGLRRAGDPEFRQIALRDESQIVVRPVGKRRRTSHPAIRESAGQPVPGAHRVVHELSAKQRRQFDHRHASGERLADRAHQRWRDRSKQDEAALATPIRVDRRTKPRKDRRMRLRLVEDEPGLRAAARSRDQSRPLEIETQPIRLDLEIEVRAAERLGERGLAALARTDEGRGGKLPQGRSQQRHHEAAQHVCRLPMDW